MTAKCRTWPVRPPLVGGAACVASSLGEALDACWPLRSTSRSSKTRPTREPSGTGARVRGGETASGAQGSPSDRGLVLLLEAIDAVAPSSRVSRRRCSSRRTGIHGGSRDGGEHGHRGLHPFFFSVDAALMKAAKDCGMAIRTWTVDDPARSSRSPTWASTQSSPTTLRRPAGARRSSCPTPHRHGSVPPPAAG